MVMKALRQKVVVEPFVLIGNFLFSYDICTYTTFKNCIYLSLTHEMVNCNIDTVQTGIMKRCILAFGGKTLSVSEMCNF